eukprot:jgi/Mesvir1/6969/Mv09113-RA.2
MDRRSSLTQVGKTPVFIRVPATSSYVNRPPMTAPVTSGVPRHNTLADSNAKGVHLSHSTPLPHRPPLVTDEVAVDPGGGVWLSKAVWRNVRRQLDSATIDAHRVATEHARVSAEYQARIDALTQRCAELEDHFQRTEAILRDEGHARNRLANGLSRELEEKKQEVQQHKFAATAQQYGILHVLRERDRLEVEVDRLHAQLVDVDTKLKEAEHRLVMTKGQLESWERDAKYLKGEDRKHRETIAALDAKCAEQELTLRKQKDQIEFLEDAVRRHPGRQLQATLDETMKDNARLVRLLSHTPEFKLLVMDLCRRNGSTYIPLSEALVTEGFVTGTYNPEVGDRPVRPSDEILYWVPSEVLAVVNHFLDKYQPNLPSQPFMDLILQINKIWRRYFKGRGAQRVAPGMGTLKAGFTVHTHDELTDLRRQLRARVSYNDILARNKIAFLKKKLKMISRGDKSGASVDASTAAGHLRAKAAACGMSPLAAANSASLLSAWDDEMDAAELSGFSDSALSPRMRMTASEIEAAKKVRSQLYRQLNLRPGTSGRSV